MKDIHWARIYLKIAVDDGFIINADLTCGVLGVTCHQKAKDADAKKYIHNEPRLIGGLFDNHGQLCSARVLWGFPNSNR